MDKEKEIESMAEIITDSAFNDMSNSRSRHKYGVSGFYAEALINAGYGNVEQAVKEFAQSKIKPLIDELVELLFNDDEPNCRVDDCEKGSDIPCGCSICVEENKQVWKSKVDKLVKEFCDNEENKN